jgi:uncharacterized membrane protein
VGMKKMENSLLAVSKINSIVDSCSREQFFFYPPSSSVSLVLFLSHIFLSFGVLKFELRALDLLGRCSTCLSHASSLLFLFFKLSYNTCYSLWGIIF